jgi:hypothetical protein
MKLRPVGAELFHTDKETYEKANSRFPQLLQGRLIQMTRRVQIN